VKRYAAVQSQKPDYGTTAVLPSTATFAYPPHCRQCFPHGNEIILPARFPHHGGLTPAALYAERIARAAYVWFSPEARFIGTHGGLTNAALGRVRERG